MAYCTITDVRGLNPKRTYNATTTPTEAQVGQYITDIAAEIDSIIQAQGYTVPVTAPANFVTVLKLLNARGAAAQAEIAMFPESGVGATPHGQQLLSLYKDGLKALRAGEIPETITGQTTSPVGSYYTEVADQESYPEPAFRKSSSDMEY
jgi:hypothetical protein